MRHLLYLPLLLLLVLTVQAGMKEANSTGTAFVVHPDGYLLTCAHVVCTTDGDDADEVKVTLDGKTYTASILAKDIQHDIALLQIQAKNLPVLTLANSNTVQLGEEVRAVGYPLAGTVGQDVKITRGSVSGVTIVRSQKAFQIDAAVNPGNSGGPLVNERGEVVGIVYAKLSTEQIENTGFTAPINYARSILRDEFVEIPLPSTTAPAPPKLEGPALAKYVATAVALVTVRKQEWVEEENTSDWADQLAFVTISEYINLYFTQQYKSSILSSQVTTNSVFLQADNQENALLLVTFFYYDKVLPAKQNAISETLEAFAASCPDFEELLKPISNRWNPKEPLSHFVVEHIRITKQDKAECVGVTIDGTTSTSKEAYSKAKQRVEKAGGRLYEKAN